MLILLVNDDGIREPGLAALEKALSGHTVRTVAPLGPCSGVGMSLGLYSSLSTTPCGDGRTGVAGTPVDCVKLALSELLPRPPDLVVSGINPGANLGNNIWYSGTVAAATEASFWGIPAMAVSVESAPCISYEAAADLAVRLVEDRIPLLLPAGVILNVNLPQGTPRGVLTTVPGSFSSEVPFVRNPDGSYSYGPYELQGIRENRGTDVHALMDGYASISLLSTRRDAVPVPPVLEDWCRRRS